MKSDRLTIIIEKGKKRIITQSPIHGIDRLVFVINHQFTNAPNTTQLASGAGRSSAAGSNAAIKSPHSQQQQSVGAGGKAKNRIGAKGKLSSSKGLAEIRRKGKEIIVVINDQIVKLPKHAANASATQVASGAGKYSTSGTNSAIESPGTKQQDAVGGNGKASNTLASKRRKKK
ncbi:hypothetical protein GC096_27205 [Paenibacillus sp. LMG 31461]|uniref:Uncharacterized protein n=1 Tax=Paenibacillus plantarum TaxID=2654975 RepID=A0ABX1XIJ0_9BACL|nr:hypothetical protein [Paenibacillus plantarum]NOU67718.1 hypothetical protein [Paenibacillus plantarum]